MFKKTYRIMREGDKVKSSLSLWSGDIGIVWSYVSDDLIWVIFPETDRHESYQQSFTKNQLILCKKN